MKKLLFFIFTMGWLSVLGQPGPEGWYSIENFSGAHSMSLGGAATASIADYNAVYWNPANLTLLEGVSFGVNLQGQQEVLTSSGISSKFLVSSNILNSAGLAFPFKINHVFCGFGINYYTKNDFSKKYSFADANGKDVTYTYKGGQRVIGIGFAVGDSNRVSFGISYNLHRMNTTGENDANTYDYKWTGKGSFLEFGINTLLFERLRLAAKINKKFSTQDERTYNKSTVKWRTEYPLFYTLGSELLLGEMFRINLDYKKNDWSLVTYSINDKNPAIPANNNQIKTLSLGFEIGMRQSGYFAFGVNRNKLLDVNSDNKQIETTGLCFGYGVWGAIFRWNVGLMYEFKDVYNVDTRKNEHLYIGTDINFMIK